MSKRKVSFNEKTIKKHLLPQAKAVDIDIYKSVDSTNELIKSHLCDGQDRVIIAAHQTKGRGRLGRSFYSPQGCGIYMSLLLHIEQTPSSSLLLTSAAAVAVAKAIENICGTPAQIKWVNDVFIGGKKAAGILCESRLSGQEKSSCIIVGIGINLISPKNFPDELSHIATSVCGRKLPTSDTPSIICAEIINELYSYSNSLSEAEFRQEYKERLFIIGKQVLVSSANEEYSATVLGIDDDLHLLVRRDDGEERLLSHGEISIRI